MPGSVIRRVVSQHARGGRGLLGAGQLGRPRRLHAGDTCSPLDGINLQLLEGGAGEGTSCKSASESRVTVNESHLGTF